MGFFSSIFGNGKPSEANKFDILRDDGVRAMQMGELPYAEKCLKAALGIQRDLKTTGFLAEVYLRMRNHAEALPLLEELASSEARTIEISLLLAQTQGDLKLYADEQTTCKAILSEQPEESRALYLAAEACHGLNEDLPAIVHLTQCLAIRPDFERAQLLRARILASMGQWNEVLADAEALVGTDHENEEYLSLRAGSYAALGRMDEAIADLESVRSLNPFNQEAILQLGAIYEATKQWDKALSLYDEAIDLQPEFALAYKARGGVKHHLKDEAGAADDLKRMLELAPEKNAELDGQYSNVENKMNAQYRSMNPYGF